ncbi:MAG: CcmD family protein [Bacteroidia bacterium]
MTKKMLAFGLLLGMTVPALAQSPAPEMADTLYSSGKIYVVVCVAALVMSGLILYLALIDRKVSKIERELNSRKKVS